jgi:beta-glucanase (GH16 family)
VLEPRFRGQRIVPIILLFVASVLVLAAVAMHAQIRGYMVRCATSPSGQAMSIGDIPGWHQVFADDFSGTALTTSNWGPYSGQPGGDTAGWWSPSHVVVSNCLLTLKGYKDATAKPGVFVTGGVGMKDTHAQTYGKYLVRMRADKGDGISAIALLWPRANVWPPEVDFFEDGGGNRTSTTATLHCGPNGIDNCQVQRTLTGYDFSQWHTLGVEWTAGKLVYTIDGTPWATVTDAGVPSIPMVLDLQSQSLECSQWNTCLDSSTPAEVDMQIDWVVAYSPTR